MRFMYIFRASEERPRSTLLLASFHGIWHAYTVHIQNVPGQPWCVHPAPSSGQVLLNFAESMGISPMS